MVSIQDRDVNGRSAELRRQIQFEKRVETTPASEQRL
jgi:hypothetical protein